MISRQTHSRATPLRRHIRAFLPSAPHRLANRTKAGFPNWQWVPPVKCLRYPGTPRLERNTISFTISGCPETRGVTKKSLSLIAFRKDTMHRYQSLASIFHRWMMTPSKKGSQTSAHSVGGTTVGIFRARTLSERRAGAYVPKSCCDVFMARGEGMEPIRADTQPVPTHASLPYVRGIPGYRTTKNPAAGRAI